MKNIWYRFTATWALLVFAITMLIFYIPIALTGLFPEPRKTILVFKIFRFWMSIFFLLSGVRRRYRGKENFNTGGPFIVLCNHRSFMDVPLTSPGIPGANKTIAKIEMTKIPLFGMVYKRGSVIVDRKNEESRRKSYAKMKDVLGMGLHMCIYPEGTRNKTSQPLQKFHDGAFRLASETGHSIIPAVIFGTGEVLPADKGFYLKPRRVEMHFLPPVHVNGRSMVELKEEVYNLMQDYYLKHPNIQ